MENLTLFDPKEKSKRISSSMLTVYNQCPRRYKFAYVDKLPHLKTSDIMYFGSALHNILCKFFNSGNRSLEYLLSLIRLDEPWDQRANEILLNFYQTNDVLANPFLIEKSFKVNYLGQTLIGKFDRVDKNENGFEIIDYKLGESSGDIKEDKGKIQWIFYWIAMENAFSSLGKVEKFSYFFLSSNKKVEIIPTESELIAAKKRVDDLIVKLLNDNDFIPTKNRHCTDCEQRNNCPIY